MPNPAWGYLRQSGTAGARSRSRIYLINVKVSDVLAGVFSSRHSKLEIILRQIFRRAKELYDRGYGFRFMIEPLPALFSGISG